ncbi:MAG: hypothetical protein E7353_01850 [Clostridiales bacterium]|nr:hypothetical protein [Clostridiales bacterium]
MKKLKIFALLLVTCIFALTLGAFVGCSSSEPKKENLTALEHSTISAVGILNANSASVQTISSEVNTSKTFDFSLSGFEDIIQKNLAIAYTTSNDGIVKSEVTASDKDGYEFKYTVTVTGKDGVKKDYTFHYNTTAYNGDEQFGEGIVEINGTEFFVKSEVEIENGEEEYTFTIAKGDNAYIVIEQEIENDEQSFVYSAYVNGYKVFETETEYEIDRNGKIEVSYSIEVAGVELEYSYNFVTENGETYAKVDIELDKDDSERKLSFKFRIDIDLGGVVQFVPIK